MPREVRITRAEMFWLIFKKPEYIIAAAIGMLLNYAVFAYLILYSNKGVFMVVAPLYLLYPVMATGGVMIAIAAYSIRVNAIRAASKASEGFLGVALPAIVSMIASCVCSYPIFATILIVLGVNILTVSNIVHLVSVNQAQIIVAVLAVNLILIYYYLGVVARGCSITPRRKRG
ncbi:MAG: hypothetical protein KGI00_00430 [Candidatus Micrarchaeota archaeon]|nr:hypothetical protein [Candidatus Micrarchaeota archaeon]MDE1823705.1 hypothetical protein [Candidatus Micrarchaeota archaeon]MDE1849179.1 hypothetical protein [Candidatus Micrarchaeota archaeon]